MVGGFGCSSQAGEFNRSNPLEENAEREREM